MTQVKSKPVAASEDIMTCLLFNSLARAFDKMLFNEEVVPEPIRSAAALVVSGTREMEEKVAREVPDAHITVSTRVMADAATLIQLITRINNQEGQVMYAEVLNLITEFVQAVFYAQSQRKKLYMPKYKALIKLFSSEVVADTNGAGSQVLYQKATQALEEGIFIRSSLGTSQSSCNVQIQAV